MNARELHDPTELRECVACKELFPQDEQMCLMCGAATAPVDGSGWMPRGDKQ